MKKGLVFNILTAVFVLAVCIGCGGGGSDRIRMTVEGSGEVTFRLFGSGMATVDWGDGSDRTTLELSSGDGWGGGGTRFSKIFAGSGRHTITITGNDIIGFTIGTGSSRTVRFSDGRWGSEHYYTGGELLTSLDVRRNPKLMTLTVRGTQLTSLDVSNNTALTDLILRNNRLTSLNVSGNTALTRLDVINNQLTSLNASGNRTLTRIYARNNQLTSLNVSSNTALRYLGVQNNQFTNAAFNALFESLPATSGMISINGNPGTDEARLGTRSDPRSNARPFTTIDTDWRVLN